MRRKPQRGTSVSLDKGPRIPTFYVRASVFLIPLAMMLAKLWEKDNQIKGGNNQTASQELSSGADDLKRFLGVLGKTALFRSMR